jgi:hypothetical protein
MRRPFIGIAIIGIVGCEPARSPGSSFAPIPSELTGEIERVRTLGREIHEYDVATAIATDALEVAKVRLDDAGILGFVTMAAEDGFHTSFVTGTPAGAAQTHEVIHAPGGKPVLKAFDPPQPLDPGRAARFHATVTARKAHCQPTDRPRNAVVLPADRLGGTGWLVWLLIATTDANEVPLAGHCRVHVSKDGMAIIATSPLSKTVLVDRRQAPPGGTVEAFGITHFGRTPNETHVATSLTYRVPLVVATNDAMWWLDGDRIKYSAR